MLQGELLERDETYMYAENIESANRITRYRQFSSHALPDYTINWN